MHHHSSSEIRPFLVAILALVVFPDCTLAQVCESSDDCGLGSVCFWAGREKLRGLAAVPGECVAGVTGLPCKVSSECTRGYCQKSPLPDDEGNSYCGVFVPCSSADECEAGEVCEEILGESVCVAGIWNSSCGTSSECVGVLQCIDNICSEMDAGGTPDVIAASTVKGQSDDVNKTGSCWNESNTHLRSPAETKIMHKNEKTVNNLATASSAFTFAGAATLGVHSFAVCKFPDSSKCRMLRFFLCVGTALFLVLASCLQVAVVAKRSVNTKNADKVIVLTDPGYNCAASVMGIPQVPAYFSRLAIGLITSCAILLNVAAVSVAGVIEVVRTERLRRFGDEQKLGVHSRWICLVLITFLLLGINIGLSVAASLRAGGIYLPDLQGCERKRYRKSVSFSCDPNVALRKYRYLGTGVSELCQTFEKEARLEPNRTRYCSPGDLIARLKDAGASPDEAHRDFRLWFLTQFYLQGEPHGLTKKDLLMFAAARFCVAILNAILLILLGWNVSPLLVLGKRRKVVLVLAVLYILLTIASVALTQQLRVRLTVEYVIAAATSACGCTRKKLSSLDINVGINIGEFRDIFLDIIIPSLVATMALNEVLMKRDGNNDDEPSLVDKVSFETGSSGSL